MTLLESIRAGLTANVTAAYPNVNMSGYLEPPKPPWFEIDFPQDANEYDITYGRGTDMLHLIVRGVAGVVDIVETQKLLDTWMEPSGGVKDAIESDRQLGAAVDDLRVSRLTPFRRLTVPESPNTVFLCHEWLTDIVLSP